MPESYPKPWSVVELEEAFAIQDANGFRVAHVHFETRPLERRIGSERMPKAHARAIALRIAEIGK